MAYEVVTDSASNLLEDQIDAFGLHVLPLTFMIDGKQHQSYLKGCHTDLKQFYTMMRDGKVITTSLPNMADTERLMRDILEKGKDILYLGFSSGLSGTFGATRLLMQELQEQHPERKLVAIDTLSASMGEGLIVHHAMRKVRAGASLEEVAQWVEENRRNVAHWFTVDDLMFLFRGGRLSRSSAWVGTMLNIKPVLHVDDEGHLVPMEKVRGRKRSIKALLDQIEQSAVQPVADQTIFISHGDSLEDAESLADMIRDRFQVKDIVINYIDPVIGAHAGPGTIALFFMADSR